MGGAVRRSSRMFAVGRKNPRLPATNFMRTRSEAIAANIAKRIAANKTRLKFSTLYRLAIEETMSADTSNFTVPSVVPVSVKDVDSKDLITGEDTRCQAAQPNPLAGNDKHRA